MIKEKDIEKLKQNDRIEYKLDTLIVEDTFNYLEYIKYFLIIILIGGFVITKDIIFLGLGGLNYIILSIWAITYRFWKLYKRNNKYFKTIPKSLKKKSKEK